MDIEEEIDAFSDLANNTKMKSDLFYIELMNYSYMNNFADVLNLRENTQKAVRTHYQAKCKFCDSYGC